MKSRKSVKNRPSEPMNMLMSTQVGWNIPQAEGSEIAGEGGRNNHEALIPHTRIGKLNDDPDPNQVRAKIFEPEKLRRNDVAEHHAEIGPPIRPSRTIEERGPFIRVHAYHAMKSSIR